MNCRKCEKEGTLEVIVDGVEFWICEYCANSWSYKPGGKVSTKAITRVQRAQMSRAADEMDRPQPTRKVVAKMRGSVKMYNPMTERNTSAAGKMRRAK